MASENRYQSLKAWDIGTWRHWVPISAERGSLSSPQAFHDHHTSNPSNGFLCSLNPDVHPTSRFGKTMRRNLAAPIVYHKNKWEGAGLMDGYHVVGVTAIPYPRFGVLINIISKKDIAYCITIGDIPQCTCPDFIKMSTQSLGRNRCIANIFIMCLDFCARWITIMTSSFTLQHTSIMRLCDDLDLQVW